MTELRFGWHLPPFPVDGAPPDRFLAQVTRMLEVIEGSLDSVWFDDHLLPWAEFLPPGTPNLECLAALSYLAASYPGLDLGASVLCQSYRHPGMVAKMGATLHWMTGGRFILGLGAGWMEREYRAYGYPFPKASVRIAQLEEAVQVVRTLWTEAPGTFRGEHYRVEGAYCEPRPEPPPPILIGGGGERLTLRVVARHADWWNLSGGTPETYAHKLRVLAEHCRAEGRDYEEIVKSYSAEFVALAESQTEARRIAERSPYRDSYPVVGGPQQVAEALHPLVDLGVRHLILRFVDFPSTAGAELFAQEVAPLLR